MAWSRRGRLLSMVAVGLLLAGCVLGRGRGAQEPPASPAAPPGSGTAASDTFAGDVEAAIAVSEPYWKQRLGGSFRPVSRVIPYQRAGEVSCGGQPLGTNNAAYCSDGDFIAFDVRWAQQAYEQIGDAFIYYMLDHEYAHGVQVRLGTAYRFTIEQELQADCMAGAVIGDSIRSGRLRLEDGDLEELRTGLIAVADDPGQPWFAEGSHGSARQRTNAFFAGYEDSLDACDL